MPNNSTAGNGKDAAREARRQIADHKGAWRNRLLADRRVSNAAKVVGCGIAEHINHTTKIATVGVRRLAQILHMSQGPVSEAIHELVNVGKLEVEFGVQGGRETSTFKLVIDIETPDLFSFDRYELAAFIKAETEFARTNSTEFARTNSKVRRRVRQKGQQSSSKGPLEFVKSAVKVRPGEQNPGNPGNPVGTTGVTAAGDESQSIAKSASNDARISTIDEPVARTANAALQQPLAEPKRPPPRINPTATAASGADGDGGARERAYAALWHAYPNQTYEGDAPDVFYQLLDEGVDPDVLIAAAIEYAKRSEGIDPVKIKLLCFWLRVKGWEDENRYLLEGVMP
jgi:hypothetical protein